MGLIKQLTVIAMISLFTIALVTFAINFGDENEAAVKLGDDSDYSTLKTGLTGEVDTLYSGANIEYTAFQESTIQTQTESSEGGTQFKVSPTGALSQVRKSIDVGFKKVFGSDPLFSYIFTAIIGLLIITLAAYGWSAWKGNP